MESTVPEGWTVSFLPNHHQRRRGTTNSPERVNRELLRSTRAARLLPIEMSLLRLVTALVVEIDEEWTTSRINLNPKSQSCRPADPPIAVQSHARSPAVPKPSQGEPGSGGGQ